MPYVLNILFEPLKHLVISIFGIIDIILHFQQKRKASTRKYWNLYRIRVVSNI